MTLNNVRSETERRKEREEGPTLFIRVCVYVCVCLCVCV